MLKKMFFKNIKSIHSFISSFINIAFIKENMKQEFIIKKKIKTRSILRIIQVNEL